MPATTTLATATLTFGIGPGADELQLSSVSGVSRGTCLWIDRELIRVVNLVSGSNRVKVARGVGGSSAAPHSSSALVTIGRADQFYSVDPVGSPDVVILVSPYINTVNGKVFLAQGDASPDRQNVRWWQEVTNTYGQTSFGVRTAEAAPTSST